VVKNITEPNVYGLKYSLNSNWFARQKLLSESWLRVK